ncbi:MAG: hypothetical protein L6290_13975 [Thermodesulfovibrionales bacterium]|nr:hypothetical protein [Thermodesulfovibrionales bacterium]
MKIDWQRIGIKELAALISEKLREKGIDTILVGGACVSIYTKNRYLSFDLDFVTHARIKDVSAVLDEVGFRRESSRHFIRRDCPFFIEFVAPPAAIGDEPLKDENRISTKYGTVVLLTPTDSVKDRLSAYYHWNDTQALDQAMLVAKAQKINLHEVKRWSEKERRTEKYLDFLRRLRSKK